MANEDYIKKWLDDSLTDEEKKAFESSDDFRSLIKLHDALKRFKAPKYNVDQELSRLNQKKRKEGKVISMPWLKSMVRVAAVILILMTSLFYFYLNIDTAIQTTVAKKTQLYLPDSSMVALNALTKVAYKERIWKYKRLVQLDGEAYFMVSKGSKFDVVTSAGVVSVLGTQFNVKNRTNYFEVTCYEGKVQVESQNETNILLPGHAVRVVDGQIVKLENIADANPGWLSNESSFKSVPFSEVIREFERQYNVSIRTQNVDMQQLFTGSFVHQNQDLALQAITLPLNLKYALTSENQITVSARGD
jgi:ferric-dicitrate binding protein FerR (iron transport regulator)